ncbi:MAG TPA: PIN domain-containing protein [Tepidisphaeraceae bacterium]|jgi:predicted nucleic acid-binding protein|nr:PIN domain-containing protein [Tepidisphaeraceae bacterium]
MKPTLILDSTPLGLLFQKPRIQQADDCREWLKQQLARGVRVIVPEIVQYELRRELLRLGRVKAERALVEFASARPDRFLPINTPALELAAELWARSRRQGKPTAHPHALDIDVILAAQVLAAGFNPSDFVVATSNITHLSLFVPAAPWESI